MAAGKAVLPHESTQLYLTDGGLETTLVFLEGFELPFFAAFDLLKDERGSEAIRKYYRGYLEIASQFKTAFILESPTWRANPDWIERIGYPVSDIKQINEKAVQLLTGLKEEYEDRVQVLISGCVGPRGDGYKPENKMTVEEAANYHSQQVAVFSRTSVDLITAVTMNYVEEAIGIAFVANALNLPVVISFTVETNGMLPTGMSLKEAIETVDAGLAQQPLYYMINCAHPTHFQSELAAGKREGWTKRIKGIRANASCKSHAELDESTELDRGDPEDLGKENRFLKASFDQLNVFGGCCGTDLEHISEIARQLRSA